MNAPCKDCPNRVAGCHSRCEAYAEYARKREAIRQERYMKSIFDGNTPGKEAQLRKHLIKQMRSKKHGR